MTFPINIEPPVIQGDVPADYRGRLYYRTRVVSFDPKKPLWDSLSLDRRIKALGAVDLWRAAERKHPTLCDVNGELHRELRVPFKAQVKKNARRNWDEMSWHNLCLVSERVRNVIEEMAPGVHFFVRNDVDDPRIGSFPVYVFFCGQSSGNRPAVSLDANGISWTPSTTGHRPVYKSPEWLSSDAFGYLDASVMNDTPLLYDYETGLLFSHALVERLGRVTEDRVFVPMGLA
jgi:hypothetical protein